MNALWTRVLRSVYRKEPITGFVIIAGAVDVAIGGIDQSSSLVFFGLSLVSVALALRWWQQFQQRRSVPTNVPQRAPIGILPPQSSRPSLPNLTTSKKPR